MHIDKKEICVGLVVELLNGIDAGDFDNIERIPERYTYLHLYALMKLADELDDGRELYGQLLDLAVAHGRTRIARKIQSGEKIRITFLAISAAEWPAGELYRLLVEDDRIECCVVIVPLTDRDAESRKDTYSKTKEFFKQNDYMIREIYDMEKDVCLSWSDLGGIPDILIHLTPWFTSLPDVCRVTSFPLRCIHCYIPYGFSVDESRDRKYSVDLVFNHDFVNMMWKVYVESGNSMDGYRNYGMLQGKNTVFPVMSRWIIFIGHMNGLRKRLEVFGKFPKGRKHVKCKGLSLRPIIL